MFQLKTHDTNEKQYISHSKPVLIGIVKINSVQNHSEIHHTQIIQKKFSISLHIK